MTRKNEENEMVEKTDEEDLPESHGKGFRPGVSGNPKGRPKGSGYAEELRTAIRTVEKKEKVKLFTHFVQQAYKNPKVLAVLMDKLVPNKQHTELDVTNLPEIHIHYDDDVK
jgi:hypothetical protein